jgi:O-antigen/teichoic acid export membrane protein
MANRPSQKKIAANVNRGLAWIGVASSLVGILDLAALLIITRFFISTEEYGISRLGIWIYPILDQATDLGLSAAVIQRDDHDDEKISTVFWINLITAAILFIALAIIAPIASDALFNHRIIGYMMVAYGTKLLFQNVYFIPVAMMKREFRFKELSIIRIIANIAEFVGKVGFAALGFGIWCFVLGPMLRVLVTGVGAQLRHPWRPKFVMRFREAKEYVTFGLNTSTSQMLFYFYTNIHLPIVGYYFGPTAAGLYGIANEIVLEPIRIISAVIVDVAFPTFARLRHERDRLIGQLVSFTRLNLITVMLYSAIVFVAADEVITVLFPKYHGAEHAVRILGIVAILRSVSLMVPPLLDGIGYPNRTLVYTATAAIVLPIVWIASAVFLGDLGYISVAIGWGVGYPVAFAVLIGLAMYSLKWSWLAYFRAVGGVAACMVAGGAVAAGVLWSIGGPPAVRLALAAVLVVGVSALLLAYTQGLSLRTARRALKGEPVAAGSEGDASSADQKRLE